MHTVRQKSSCWDWEVTDVGGVFRGGSLIRYGAVRAWHVGIENKKCNIIYLRVQLCSKWYERRMTGTTEHEKDKTN